METSWTRSFRLMAQLALVDLRSPGCLSQALPAVFESWMLDSSAFDPRCQPGGRQSLLLSTQTRLAYVLENEV